MFQHPARHVRLVACALLLSLAGCATGMPFEWPGTEFPVATRKHPANKILAWWEPGQGPGNDRLTTRGCIGTVMFVSERRGGTPVRVRGTLRIYLFDDQGAKDEQTKPIHEYVLPPDTLDACFQKTQLGGVYGLFIPYTRPGLQQTTCTLRMRFTPVDEHDQPLAIGGILSEMGTVTLPGTQVKKEEDKELVLQKSKMTPLPPSEATQESRATALEQARESVAQLGKPSPPPNAIPLTDEERQRIMSEAMARQESNPLTPVDPDDETHDWNDPPAIHKGHPLDGGEELPEVPESAVHPLETESDAHPLGAMPQHPLSETEAVGTPPVAPPALAAPNAAAVQTVARSGQPVASNDQNPLRDPVELVSSRPPTSTPSATVAHPLSEGETVPPAQAVPAPAIQSTPGAIPVPVPPVAPAPANGPANAPTFAAVETPAPNTSGNVWPHLQSLLLVVLSVTVVWKPAKSMVLKTLGMDVPPTDGAA